MAFRLLSVKLFLRGKMDFCSRRERYLAEVPNWVMESSSIRRGIVRGPWGAKGEPSYRIIVAPEARPETSQCHIIQVVVVK